MDIIVKPLFRAFSRKSVPGSWEGHCRIKVGTWSPKTKIFPNFSCVMTTWPITTNVMTCGLFLFGSIFTLYPLDHPVETHFWTHSSLFHPRFPNSFKRETTKRITIKQNEDQSQFRGQARVPRLQAQARLGAFPGEGSTGMTMKRSWPGRHHRHDCFKRSIFIRSGVAKTLLASMVVYVFQLITEGTIDSFDML